MTSPSWQRREIRSVALGTETWNPEQRPKDKFTYVDVSAVDRSSFSIVSPARLEGRDAPSRARKLVRAGDVIYATVRPSLRRIAFVDAAFDGAVASTAFCVLRPNPSLIEPRFLYYAMLTDDLNAAIASHASGASYPAVLDRHVLDQSISLPPLKTQRGVVAVLDLVHGAMQNETKAVATAQELKQAALARLFSIGFENVPTYETPYGPLPQSWETRALGECCAIQAGVTKGRRIPAEEAVEVPYLRVANVQDGRLNLEDIKTIAIRKEELAKYALHDGDVVLTEGGDLDKLGRGFIWRSEIRDCVHQNHIFAVRTDRSCLLPEFLAYLVQSPYGRAYFLSVAHKTTNLASINQTKLRALPIPIPPLKTQERVAEALAVIDERVRSSEGRLTALQDLFRTLLGDLMTQGLDVDRLRPPSKEMPNA